MMGAFIGRLNLFQIVKFVVLYLMFWNLNYFLLIYFLVKGDFSEQPFAPYFFDMFGTTFVYLFASMFALPLACSLRKQSIPEMHPRNTFNRSSLTLSQIGTGFIIVAWFFTSCGVINYKVYPDSMARSLSTLSTILGTISSMCCTYLTCLLLGGGRAGYKHALLGAIPGGVVLGAGIVENVGVVLMIGSVAGVLTGIYMNTIHKVVNRKYVKDVIGLFGPFFISALIGSVVVVPAVLTYYYNKNEGFPFAPTVPVPRNLAAYQLIYAGLSAGIGLGGGIVTSILSTCDSDYYSLASNHRIFNTDFGLYD